MIDLHHLYRHTLAARASAEAAGFAATAAALRALAADIAAATTGLGLPGVAGSRAAPA